MTEPCKNCNCPEYCYERNICLDQALTKRYDANDKWEDDTEELAASGELAPVPDINVELGEDILKAVIKG